MRVCVCVGGGGDREGMREVCESVRRRVCICQRMYVHASARECVYGLHSSQSEGVVPSCFPSHCGQVPTISWLLPSSRRGGLYGETRFVVVEVLLYVHRNRRFIMDGSPGCPPRLSHSS